MEQFSLKKESGPVDLEAKTLEFRKKNSKLYISIQVELLIKKYGDRKTVDRMYEEASELYSQEYAEAFYEVTRDRMKADPEFSTRPVSDTEIIKSEIERKIADMHELEQKMLESVYPSPKTSTVFFDWHKKYGKRLITIIHNNPELLTQFEESKDRNPEVQRGLLEKIETGLYQ